MLIALGKPGVHVVNRQSAEMLLVERLTSGAGWSGKYLIECGERLQELAQKIHHKTPEQEEFIQSANMLLVRYFGHAMLRPSAFDASTNHGAATGKFLELLTSANPKMPSGFLKLFCENHDEDTLHKIFRPVFRGLSKQMREQTLLTSYQPTVAAMRTRLKDLSGSIP